MATDRLIIEVLVFEGCPNAEETFDLVTRVAARLAPQSDVAKVEIDTPERAAEVGFLGSPSVRVNGLDIEGRAGEGALACRTYDGMGVPPEWMIEAAIARGLEPAGILFLCVANSARSQMAEGIARSMAPIGVKIWSAGSQPTRVRPEVAVALSEIRVDITGQRARSIAEIPATEVDTVITLCAAEECPVFPGKSIRLHWPLPDPALVVGSEEECLSAFRHIRDELARRIGLLLLI